MTADDIAELSERAARVIQGGGGLKALAQLLADAAEGAVLVEDDQWRHLALAECRPGVGTIPSSFAAYYVRRTAGESDGRVARAKVDERLNA